MIYPLIVQVRHELGRQLAREQPCPPEIDVVVGVPDSSIPMAIGYASNSFSNLTSVMPWRPERRLLKG
jgi:glutamine phosphoribosylpyrophosphate amidotransferase